MLERNEKINIFEAYLAVKYESYGDIMRDGISNYFNENQTKLSFLDKLKNVEEIERKVDFLVSKMILHEHEDGLQNIIVNYL